MFAALWCALADPTPTGHNDQQLTGKRRAFIEAYLGVARFNASEAARIAGYANPPQDGHRLLRNDDVRARIDERFRADAVSADEVRSLLAQDARRSDEDILLQSRKASPGPGESSVISSLVSARTSARQSLAKAHGLFTENHNITGSLTREFVIRHVSTNMPLDGGTGGGS